MRRFAYRSVLLAMGLLAAGPAHAAWQRASSRHFIIYSDERPDRLQAFGDQLERFDAAVRKVRDMPDPDPGDNNRVTIFVLPTNEAVAKLLGPKAPNAYGFYNPRASGSLAFVPRWAGNGTPYSLDPQIVLFHEYAHHLMFQEADQAYPLWFVEGFAEFMSTARIGKDGSVGIGLPANHRVYGLTRLPANNVSWLLGNAGIKSGSLDQEQLYARGWLLTHFLAFDPARQGQLVNYLDRFSRGEPPLAAAKGAFGDLSRLDRDLDIYLERNRFAYLTIPAAKLKVAPVTVTALSPGAAAVMPWYIRIRRGVLKKDQPAVETAVRGIEAQYRGDPLVEQALAETETDSGDYAAAEAAADRAIAADPRSARALTLKGIAVLRAAKGREPEVKEARALFIAANKLDTEDPEPLLLFYNSFVADREKPNANAIAALHYASALAPQDGMLRVQSARLYWQDGKTAEARQQLLAVAYNPHGGPLSDVAKRMIDAIDQHQPAGSAMVTVSEKPDATPVPPTASKTTGD